MSTSSIVPPLMEAVWSRRGHVGLESGFIICARALTIVQSCPHVRVSLQHVFLKKKMHEVHTRYLTSDVQADVLAHLGHQQRSCSTSEIYEVELSFMQWNWIWKKYTLCVLGIQHASKC